jgi:hypothetical protein
VYPPEFKYSSNPWEPDEDELLVALVSQYGENWDLVSTWVNSGYGKRTSWECCDRYSQLYEPEGEQLPFNSLLAGDVGADPKLNPSKKNVKVLSKRKAMRFAANFDIITKTSKKREASQTPKSGM